MSESVIKKNLEEAINEFNKIGLSRHAEILIDAMPTGYSFYKSFVNGSNCRKFDGMYPYEIWSRLGNIFDEMIKLKQQKEVSKILELSIMKKHYSMRMYYLSKNGSIS